ncbi:unnamed protein product [Enterobius vermicularis]|uniref:Ovule protein n=1 Tax=Enterobius vermicularis TaxID=51028 RepID=A0A0N4V412_ENTVE|nr:unnamed protein product [Enterobius vermicularis]
MLREAPVCCLLAVGQVDEEKNLILRNLLQVMGYGGGSQSAIKGVIVQFSSAVKSMQTSTTTASVSVLGSEKELRQDAEAASKIVCYKRDRRTM